LFAVADEAPQLFLALRRRSVRVADSSQSARFSVKIAVGGDLELVNRDTPLSGYSGDDVKKRPETATWSRCPSGNVSIFTCACPAR
jgi:hypothetical protein